jgi:hypothetical protein
MAEVVVPQMHQCPPNYFRKIARAAARALFLGAAVAVQAASQRESNLAAVPQAAPASLQMGPCPPNYFRRAGQQAVKAEFASLVMARRPPNYFPRIAREEVRLAVMRVVPQCPADRAKLLQAGSALPTEQAARARRA